MRSAISSVLEVAGFTLIAVGLGSIFLPLGIIAAGAALVLIGYAIA